MANSGDLNSLYKLRFMILKYTNFWYFSLIYHDPKDSIGILRLHSHPFRHIASYFGLWSTGSVTALMLAQVIHGLYSKGLQLQRPEFMMLLLFTIVNSLIVRAQYECVVNPRSVITKFRLAHQFLIGYESRNGCRIRFPIRYIKLWFLCLLMLQWLTVLGFLIDCELILGTLMPVCPTQTQVPIVVWIWKNYPYTAWSYIVLSMVYLNAQFYCAMMLSSALLLMVLTEVHKVLTFNRTRTMGVSHPDSEQSLRKWASEQLIVRVLCTIFNETLDPIKVFSITIILSYDVLICYSLIKVRYNPAMTVYMVIAAVGTTIGLLVLCRQVYTAHHVSAEELKFRQMRARGTGKYWLAYVRACRPWRVNVGNFCRSYTRDSNVELWRTVGDNLVNLLVTF